MSLREELIETLLQTHFPTVLPTNKQAKNIAQCAKRLVCV